MRGSESSALESDLASMTVLLAYRISCPPLLPVTQTIAQRVYGIRQRMNLQGRKSTDAMSSNSLDMYLDLKSANGALKPHHSDCRIWWSLRNWLETRPCRVIVCQHLLPRYLEPLATFSSQTSHCFLTHILGVCPPGSQLRVSDAGISILEQVHRATLAAQPLSLPKLFPRRDIPGITIQISKIDIFLFSLFFLNSFFYFLQTRWSIEYSSHNWNMSKTVSIKPEPMGLPLCLESCLHLSRATAVLTVLG